MKESITQSTARRPQFQYGLLAMVVFIGLVAISLALVPGQIDDFLGWTIWASMTSVTLFVAVGLYIRGTPRETTNFVITAATVLTPATASVVEFFRGYPTTIWAFLTTDVPLMVIAFGNFPVTVIVYTLVRVCLGLTLVVLSLKVWDRLTVAKQALVFGVPLGLLACKLGGELCEVWTARFGDFYAGQLRGFYLATYATLLASSAFLVIWMAWRAKYDLQIFANGTKVLVFGYVSLFWALAHLVLFPLSSWP